MRALGLVAVTLLTAVTLNGIALVLAANTLPAETVDGVNTDSLASRVAQVAPLLVAAGASLVALRFAWSALADDGSSAAPRRRRARAWLTAALTLASLWFVVVVVFFGR